jgi:hypothetical protein
VLCFVWQFDIEIGQSDVDVKALDCDHALHRLRAAGFARAQTAAVVVAEQCVEVVIVKLVCETGEDGFARLERAHNVERLRKIDMRRDGARHKRGVEHEQLETARIGTLQLGHNGRRHNTDIGHVQKITNAKRDRLTGRAVLDNDRHDVNTEHRKRTRGRVKSVKFQIGNVARPRGLSAIDEIGKRAAHGFKVRVAHPNRN